MAKKCIECGKKKGIFDYDYAGLSSRHGRHPFPERIGLFYLPRISKQGIKTDFLCRDCASNHKVVCKKHGEIQGSFKFGSAPVCQKCVSENTGKSLQDYYNELARNVSNNSENWGFWPIEGRVKKIGREIDAQFGFAGMQEVNNAIRSSHGAGPARELERIWDGIGQWRG